MKISKTIPEIKEAGTDAVIAELFCMYVSSMENKPRHTAQANLEVDIFDQFCAGAFPHNARLQEELYDRMMNVAVEFEESGFIAGFKAAFRILENAGFAESREVTGCQG